MLTKRKLQAELEFVELQLASFKAKNGTLAAKQTSQTPTSVPTPTNKKFFSKPPEKLTRASILQSSQDYVSRLLSGADEFHHIHVLRIWEDFEKSSEVNDSNRAAVMVDVLLQLADRLEEESFVFVFLKVTSLERQTAPTLFLLRKLLLLSSKVRILLFVYLLI